MSPKRFLVLILVVMWIFPMASLGGSGEKRALLEWARSRFVSVGLTYPTVRVIFHDGLSACGQRVGLYDGSTSTVHLCRHEKRVLLHELAHAWTEQNMSHEDRHDFQLFRGLETWGSHDEGWSERATEHAAETLTWALIDENLLVRWVSDGADMHRLLSIPNSSHDELVDAFEMLTGMIPVHRVHDRPSVVTNAFSPELARIP